MSESVCLYKKRGDTSIYIDAQITDAGNLQISGQDVGKAPEEFWGDTDYEYWVTVGSEHKDSVLLALIERLFAGHPSAHSQFMEFLKSKGIPYKFDSWI
jgi:hypothetical protein